MSEIEKLMRAKVCFAEGTSTTKAGSQKFSLQKTTVLACVKEVFVLSKRT
jgi:hypothetical protein